MSRLLIFLLGCGVFVSPLHAAPPKKQSPFQWVNTVPAKYKKLVQHSTFPSKANHNAEVGYCILLPPGYDKTENAEKHYPVIYYLHGGRPGSEVKSIRMAEIFDEAMRAERVPPIIYVFVNGGAMSHYDFPKLQSFGETAFVKELIPHVDAHYRTIANRNGRGIEGFSQGGRGTGRIMFKYPALFCSAAPMGGGHQHEKHAAEHEGRETSGVQFEPGNNTYDLARKYAQQKNAPPLKILVGVGKNGMNYQANLDWMQHLKSLGIPYEAAIAGDAHHSAVECYKNLGDRVMLFHAKNFQTPEAGDQKSVKE